VRPTNNYGIGQYTEKFIPNVITRLCQGEQAKLHDQGKPVRTWLHVGDTVRAVLKIISAGCTNEIFNISGNCEFPNRQVAAKIMNCMGIVDEEKYLDLSVKRPGQDIRYAINDKKLQELGWCTRADFDAELQKIVTWYIDVYS
jgi:dTDP-glucose 4,6-dehydratase